ncbi:MAG: CPBP family intramembrane metalloprotease, partial [Planctomycetes bacterium]|nr:CPBP family intramembrane metalloprotease [Planctomycetota bacterium]
SIAEELLFRGLVLQAFRGMLRVRGAVIVSAVLFGAFHMSLHRFFPQAVLGALLAILVVRTGSLWPAVLAHAVHNGILVVWDRCSDASEVDIPLPYMLAPLAVGLTLVGLGLVVSRSTRAGPAP